MAIDTTKKVKKVTVDGALMPFSSAIDANIRPENIKKDVTILGVTGTLESGGGLPEYMSAKNFTFDGNACTGYVGDTSVPEIIIPKSYSFFETQEQLLGSYVNMDRIFSETNSNISNITLCNEDGTNVHSYSSTSALENEGRRDFASVDKILIKQLIYSYNFITQSALKTYIKNILAVPIYYRNVVYNNTDDFLNAHFASKRLTEFGGTVAVKHFKDGEDVVVTAISQKEANTSGFKGFAGNIIIPKSISQINGYAFYNCNTVKNFFIDTPNYIGLDGFYSCKGLKHIELGALESIYAYSFYGSGIKSINIPNSVTTIGNGALSYCDNLKNVYVGSGVEQIYDTSFGHNVSLSEIIVDENNTVYDSRNDCNAIIETATNTLISGCKNTIIPESVTSIGQYAFWGCSSLGIISIPSSVTSIGNNAFDGCSGLTSITIPGSVTSIGVGAFYNCSGLTSITIPDSVTSIGNSVFYNCIGLISVTIGNGVTSIGNSTFSGCSGLTSVTMGNGVTSIGNNAFSYCSGLTSIIIPNGVKSIGNSAFRGCSSLTSITIPNSVTSIEEAAFGNCSSLTTMTIKATTPPTLKSTNAISSATTTINIPAGTLEAYQTATNWSNFADKFVELSA